MTEPFRIATRDELWIRGQLVERRLSHGCAIETGRGIVAVDSRDDSLAAVCEHEMTRMREAMPRDARVRLVATASSDGTNATMTIRRAGLSIVTQPDLVEEHDALLRELAREEPEGAPVDYRGIPILWRNGSAAVLLHEAIGHAREHGHAELEWPAWLEAGIPLRRARASFSDVPLLRMQHVIAKQHDAPFSFESVPIEILLVAGGAYEPLTETVSVAVSAARFAGRRIPPFLIREPRSAVPQALTGAEGETLSYPGVVCSREGQELVIQSAAPLMVTHFR